MESSHTITPLYDPARKPVPEEVLERLQAFADRWLGRVGNEQQLAQQHLIELCQALGTAAPGEDPARSPGDYQFEKPVKLAGVQERGRIDLYKAGHFILEAKCGRAPGEPGSAPVRGSKPYLPYIEDAYNLQARVYATALHAPPPLLLQLTLLADAASLDWSQVDSAIFGTLLERALDKVERHRLGAHYTPRAYVERLVRATLEEPLRQAWQAVETRMDGPRVGRARSRTDDRPGSTRVLLCRSA